MLDPLSLPLCVLLQITWEMASIRITSWACAQVLFKVFSGLKPKVPPDMRADYRALMEACWATEPAARPTFRDILPRLRHMLSAAREAASEPAPTQATLTN